MRREDGFTLIELLIAAVLVAIGVLALMSSFDTSRQLVTVAERNEAMTHQAERAMERILALDYEQIGLTSLPANSGDPNDPRFYVLSGNRYQWDQGATGPRADRMIQDPAGFSPMRRWEGELLPDGRRRFAGDVHRFVTEFWDPRILQTPDVPDGKRVTVAVTLDGDEEPRRPLLISSIVVDPTP